MNENKQLEEDENAKSEIFFKQGEALLKEFYEKKKNMSIEKLKADINSKVNKIKEEANKKKEDAKIMEEEANKLELDAQMLEKKIRDEIDSEEKKEIKKLKDINELSNLGDKLKTFGIEVNTDILGFIY